jgi:hypothetical protein
MFVEPVCISDATKQTKERPPRVYFDFKVSTYMSASATIDFALVKLIGYSQKKSKTYNSGYSPVVTHLTTNPPVSCLNIAERTGSIAILSVSKLLSFWNQVPIFREKAANYGAGLRMAACESQPKLLVVVAEHDGGTCTVPPACTTEASHQACLRRWADIDRDGMMNGQSC